MNCMNCGDEVGKVFDKAYWGCDGCGFGCWEGDKGMRRYSCDRVAWTDVPEGLVYVVGEVEV